MQGVRELQTISFLSTDFPSSTIFNDTIVDDAKWVMKYLAQRCRWWSELRYESVAVSMNRTSTLIVISSRVVLQRWKGSGPSQRTY